MSDFGFSTLLNSVFKDFNFQDSLRKDTEKQINIFNFLDRNDLLTDQDYQEMIELLDIQVVKNPYDGDYVRADAGYYSLSKHSQETLDEMVLERYHRQIEIEAAGDY